MRLFLRFSLPISIFPLLFTEITYLSEGWRKQRVAEVRFLRALFYSYLFTNYGGMSLISAPLDAAGYENSLFAARSTNDETAACIATDCDAATADLSQTSIKIKKGDGRSATPAMTRLSGPPPG